MNLKVIRWLLVGVFALGSLLSVRAIFFSPILELRVRIHSPALVRDAVAYVDTGHAVWPMAPQEPRDALQLLTPTRDGLPDQWLVFTLPAGPFEGFS